MRSRDDVIRTKVLELLGRSRAYHALPTGQRRQVFEDTARVVAEMARGARPQSHGDPYRGLSLGQAAGDDTTHVVSSGSTATQMGESIATGVTQAARMVREIDFPSFVASLIEGTFHAIVKSSIEQMKAYAEMVKSVATSLNEFRDQNVSENQARDGLVSRYPSLFQISINDGAPRVGLRPDADTDNLPDFQRDLGLPEPFDDLDDESIEGRLVPAMRDDVARSRMQLLATIVLMGINRIIVTDGRINAKLRFQFAATEQARKNATSWDYANMGQISVQGSSTQLGDPLAATGGASGSDGSAPVPAADPYAPRPDGRSVYATGQVDSMNIQRPDVRVTSEVNTKSDAALQASGQIMGEVAINFRSETFPLEKMVDTNQMMLLEQARGAGRGALAPTPAPAPATPTNGAAATIAPPPPPAPTARA